MLSKDFKEFVALLKEHDAAYMIVGGYAVGVHGYPRYTGDLDIWLDPSPENAEKVLRAIVGFGFGSFKLTVEDLTKEGNVIQFGQPPLRIDLLTSIDGVTFSECYANRKEVSFDGLSMNFIGYHDLVKNKREKGRHRDLDDLENIGPDK
jgi:predicted nucleotidyltransferase